MTSFTMSAEDTLRRNKTSIQRILCGDDRFILDKIYEKDLITKREYNNLKSITVGSWDRVVELVDKILNKGEKTCRDFLDLLQTDEEIKSTYPDLRNIQLHDAEPLTKPVQVSSSHSEMSLGQDNKKPKMDDLYPLNSRPVGLCLIINNVNFTSRPIRRGSDEDAKNLTKVFSELGFRVLMCKDQTTSQILKMLTWFASLTGPALPYEFRVEEWSDTGFTEPQQLIHHGDAFICCLLTHGLEGIVFGTDETYISIKDITRTFRATKQSALKGKPKVFLIQANQGEKTMDPDEDNCGGGSIPLEADVLLAIATAEGYVAFRHTVCGSFFIQSVCQQLKERCPRGDDLLTILQHVKYDVAQRRVPYQHGIWMQMPVVTSTLTKKLVLSPHHN